MNINLVDNFYIETDPHNFMLKEKYTTEKGEKKVRTLGYFNKVEHALHHLIKHRTLSDDSKLTLDEYIKKTKALADEVTQALRQVSDI